GHRLESVLAERREVDNQIDGVGRPCRHPCCLRLEHGFAIYGRARTPSGFCKRFCIAARRRACLAAPGGPAQPGPRSEVRFGSSTLGEWPAPWMMFAKAVGTAFW